MTVHMDVNALFVKNSVAEVEALLKDTRRQIEDKKEDLRTMVGERYRDLIEAADIIVTMQESAHALSSVIERTKGLCHSLQQRGLIGFKTKPVTLSADLARINENQETLYSLAVQIRILVSCPEMLWSLISIRQLLAATEMFLLARHVYTVLQLAPNATEIFLKFPVIERQWAVISDFENIIISCYTRVLSSEISDKQVIADAAASFIILKQHDLKSALTLILQLRKAFLLQSLSTIDGATSREKIAQFVSIFISTIAAVHFLFSSDKTQEHETSGRLSELIAATVSPELSGDKSQRHFLESLMKDSTDLARYMPRLIKEFRPSLDIEICSLQSEVIQTELNEWIQDVFTISSDNIASFLLCTASVKSLSQIRSCIWDVCRLHLTSDEFQKAAKELCRCSFDPWNVLIKDQVRSRAEKLITTCLNNARDDLYKAVVALAETFSSDASTYLQERDVGTFIWSESEKDLPGQVGWMSLALRSGSLVGGLYYKIHGYTSNIQTVCLSLNNQLSCLIEDVAFYGPSSSVREAFGGGNKHYDSGVSEDYEALLKYLQSETLKVFQGIIPLFEDIIKNWDSRNASEISQDEEASYTLDPLSAVSVLLGRLCHALPNLCPKLALCASAEFLCQPDTEKKLSIGMKLKSENWNELSELFLKASVSFYDNFLQSHVSSFGSQLLSKFSQDYVTGNPIDILCSLPSWEELEIEEVGEEDCEVKSKIRVPSSPSPILIKCIADLFSAVNNITSYTLPKDCHDEFIKQVCIKIIETYLELEGKVKDYPSQVLALQLLFDLRYIQLVLLPRDNRDLDGQLNEVVQKLESHIDPFDANVFSPHISTRIRLASQRSQSFLNVLGILNKQMLGSQVVSPQLSSSSSVLSLPVVNSTDIPRFSNVPLPKVEPKAPDVIIQEMPRLMKPEESDVKFKGSMPSLAVEAEEPSSRNLIHSRSAVALFSAMSSTWFGSS